jgi:hypothetical protein
VLRCCGGVRRSSGETRCDTLVSRNRRSEGSIEMPNRPFGVLVLGALAIAIAVVRLIIGLQLLGFAIFGDVPQGTGIGLAGILALVVGATYLAVGWALWSMRPWALLFTMIMAVFGLVDAVFVLLATGSLAYGLAAAAIPALLLWYTSREDIRDTFAAADESGR